MATLVGAPNRSANAPKSIYKGKTYHFMSDAHKQSFDADPEKDLNPKDK